MAIETNLDTIIQLSYKNGGTKEKVLNSANELVEIAMIDGYSYEKLIDAIEAERPSFLMLCQWFDIDFKNLAKNKMASSIQPDLKINDIKSVITGFINRNKSLSVLAKKQDEIFNKLDTDTSFANKAIAEYNNIVKLINENRDSYNEVLDFLIAIGFIDTDMLKTLMHSILQPKTKETPEKAKEKKQPANPHPESNQAAANQQHLKPIVEQPQVAHDLQQQPFGYNPAVFMQGGQQPNAIPVGQIVSTAQQIANNPQGVTMTFEEKVDYVQKHIKFIEGTHPGVNEDWFNAFIDLFKYNKFFKNKLKEYNSECRPNNPMLFEIKLENNENGLYDIAFRVNCKDKKQFILVRYGTKKVPYTDGTVRYPIDMTLMGA